MVWDWKKTVIVRFVRTWESKADAPVRGKMPNRSYFLMQVEWEDVLFSKWKVEIGKQDWYRGNSYSKVATDHDFTICVQLTNL